jgi:hypothetical protein
MDFLVHKELQHDMINSLITRTKAIGELFLTFLHTLYRLTLPTRELYEISERLF